MMDAVYLLLGHLTIGTQNDQKRVDKSRVKKKGGRVSKCANKHFLKCQSTSHGVTIVCVLIKYALGDVNEKFVR